jgi:hypothetical protein
MWKKITNHIESFWSNEYHCNIVLQNNYYHMFLCKLDVICTEVVIWDDDDKKKNNKIYTAPIISILIISIKVAMLSVWKLKREERAVTTIVQIQIIKELGLLHTTVIYVIAIFIFYLFIWFVRLLALQPLLAYCSSLGW